MATVDLPPAPATDAVTYRLRRSRLWLNKALALLLGLLVGRAVFFIYQAATGAPPVLSDYRDAALVTVVAAVAGGAVGIIGARRRPGWVRSSAAGLEFAASGRVPVFLTWPQVRSVTFRGRGPYTELLITPIDLATVGYTNAVGRAPRTRQRKGETAFVVEAGVMEPGPVAMAAELRRRMHS